MSGPGFEYTFDFLFGAEHGIIPVADTQDGLAYEADHVGAGLDLLLEQFKEKPKLEAWLSVLLGQVQDVEGALWQLLTERDIERAEGAQLDGLGAIVGEPRNGKGDELYRTHIRVRVAVLKSNGRVEELLAILSLLYGEVLTVWVRESLMGLEFDLRNEYDENAPPDVVVRILRQAKAGGVRLELQYPVGSPDDEIRFGDYEGTDVGGLGLGDYEGSDVGGFAAGVI